MKTLWNKLVSKWQLRKELKQREKERKIFANSTEPWVSIIGGHPDAANGLKLDMDWNDAFIKYLRANGVPGIKDEDVVSYWLTTIHQSNMMEVQFGEQDGEA